MWRELGAGWNRLALGDAFVWRCRREQTAPWARSILVWFLSTSCLCFGKKGGSRVRTRRRKLLLSTRASFAPAPFSSAIPIFLVTSAPPTEAFAKAGRRSTAAAALTTHFQDPNFARYCAWTTILFALLPLPVLAALLDAP